MSDLSNTPPEGGRKTSEATIVVCKCKGTRFDVKKTTTSSVLLKCGACGAEVPVKGPVAHVRAGDEDITFGVEQHTFSPATEKETKEKKPKKAKDNGERKQLRFGVPPEVLEKVNNYRPGYYSQEADTDRRCEAIIAKASNGKTGTIPLWFRGEYQQFRSWDASEDGAFWDEDKKLKPKVKGSTGFFETKQAAAGEKEW